MQKKRFPQKRKRTQTRRGAWNPRICSRKAVEFSDIACGEKVRPVSEEKLKFLRSVPNSNTPSKARQSTIITLQGVDLAMAELVNFVLIEWWR